MPQSLSGKTALITGASSGVGRALARTLAAEGVRVALAARSTAKLEALVDEIGGGALAVTADLAKAGDTDRMVEDTLAALGHIDILMANAGLFITGQAVDQDPDAWDELLAVNVNSVFRAARRVLPHMIERGSGDIVVTSSIAGHRIMETEPVYSASKHAIQAFVHSLRQQVAAHNIRVGAVAPGTILNELWGITEEAEVERRVADRTGLRSEDVAEACVFVLTRPANVTIRDIVMLPQAQVI